MEPLDDGVYDAFVVDVREDEENSAIKHVELAITSGERKGDVVRVRAARLQREPFELMGLPATLTVKDGRPSIAFDA